MMTKSQKFFCAVGMMVVGHNATVIARSVLKGTNEAIKNRQK